MTIVNCEPCNRKLQMINANWIMKDESKPAFEDNLMWCCNRCLNKIEKEEEELLIQLDNADN